MRQLNPHTKVFLGLLLLLPIVWWVREHLVVVSTRSINHHVLWKSPRSPLRQGRLMLLSFDAWPKRSLMKMMVTPQEQQWLAKIQGKWLVKRLGCLGPQQLTTLSEEGRTVYRCDGHRISQAVDHPEHHFVFNGRLSLDQGFAIGDHHSSLDSRYLGLFALSHAQRVLSWRELLGREEVDGMEKQ